MSPIGTFETCQLRRAMSEFEVQSGKHVLVLRFSQFDPERTLAQGELTSTSACFGEVDAGSPTRTYAILRMEAAGLEQD